MSIEDQQASPESPDEQPATPGKILQDTKDGVLSGICDDGSDNTPPTPIRDPDTYDVGDGKYIRAA